MHAWHVLHACQSLWYVPVKCEMRWGVTELYCVICVCVCVWLRVLCVCVQCSVMTALSRIRVLVCLKPVDCAYVLLYMHAVEQCLRTSSS